MGCPGRSEIVDLVIYSHVIFTRGQRVIGGSDGESETAAVDG